MEFFRQLSIGAHNIILGNCDAAVPVVRRLSELMSVPLVQGSLRYAYRLGNLGGGFKERGEAAAFTAAVVPRVHACSATDAATIMANMKVGAISTDFEAVKKAFEKNYGCMNILCKEVGGLWNDAESKYFDGAEPCGIPEQGQVIITETETEETVPIWAIVIIAVVVVFALVSAGVAIVCSRRAKSYERLAKGSGKAGPGMVIGQSGS